MAKDLQLSLEDRPGEGARLGEALGSASINIEGLCAITHEGRATVHILVEDAAAARSTLEAAGIKVEGETDVIVTDFASREDKPGEMGRTARALADAGINVSLVYLATRSRGVLATSDNAKARELLGL
jgi:hypothetical protein